MLYNQTAVRDNLRNRDGKRVFYLGKGDQLTSDARDWLQNQRIPILPASQARPEQWKLLTGGFSEEKPEDMTHLNGDTLVKKTHPRIRFRGAVDLLEAEILLLYEKLPRHREHLKELLQLARNLIRWELMNEAAEMPCLLGLSQEELRKCSHFPQQYYATAHFMPQGEDSPEILQLNRLRSLIRQTELTAADTFSDRDGNCTRPDLLQCLNRMSSAVYVLMLWEKGGRPDGI